MGVMPFNAFLSIMAFVLFLGGAVLVFASWPDELLRPAPLDVVLVMIGGTMVLAAGYCLAVVVL